MKLPLPLFRIAAIALIAGTLAFAPARADEPWVVTTEITYVIAGDAPEAAAADEFVDDSVEEAVGGPGTADAAATARRYAAVAGRSSASAATVGRFGPFRVIDGRRAEMIGDIDTATPLAFAAMLAAHPSLARLDLVDCPGSLDDAANFELARMVRRAGLATHVPAGGSVRSGAVDLFLAGTTRTAAPDAEFAVHSWRDEDGREAGDFADSDPVHDDYLAYYRDMGMTADIARAFYHYTNATPFDRVRTMTGADLARFGMLTH